MSDVQQKTNEEESKTNTEAAEVSTPAVTTEPALNPSSDSGSALAEVLLKTPGPTTDKETSSEISAKRAKIDVLPTRQYLDQTVVPILLQGLSSLAKERPTNPIEFLAQFLLKNKTQYEEGSQNGMGDR